MVSPFFNFTALYHKNSPVSHNEGGNNLDRGHRTKSRQSFATNCIGRSFPFRVCFQIQSPILSSFHSSILWICAFGRSVIESLGTNKQTNKHSENFAEMSVSPVCTIAIVSLVCTCPMTWNQRLNFP